MPVKEIAPSDNFDEMLKECRPKLAVIDFHAKWCGPCRLIAPEVEAIATQYADEVIVLKCDVDECGELAAKLQIQCMPTFQFYKDSQKIAEFSGASKEKLREYVMKYK